MTTGIYLPKDTILRDLHKFAIDISERLGSKVEVLDEDAIIEEEKTHLFGYYIYYNDKEYVVYMEYNKSENEEYSQKDKTWTVGIDAWQEGGFKTLGDVFDYITGKV